MGKITLTLTLETNTDDDHNLDAIAEDIDTRVSDLVRGQIEQNGSLLNLHVDSFETAVE